MVKKKQNKNTKNCVVMPTDQQRTAEISLYQELIAIGLPHFDAEYAADLLVGCKMRGEKPAGRYEASLLKRVKRLHEKHKRQPDYRQVAA